MTRKQKSACKLFAADARIALGRSANVGISAYNYGLSPSDAVLNELRTMLPDATIETHGVMGYVHFTRKVQP